LICVFPGLSILASQVFKKPGKTNNMISKSKTNYHVSLTEVHRQLRIDSNNDDLELLPMIKSAVEFAENYINKDIALTENTLVIEDYSGFIIPVDEGNLIELVSIKDADGNDLVRDELHIYDGHFTIELADYINQKNITIVFTTGYAAGLLPFPIRQAILIKVGDFYDVFRNSTTYNNMQTTRVFEDLLNNYQARKVKHITYHYK
jgi:hypothetical protein